MADLARLKIAIETGDIDRARTELKKLEVEGGGSATKMKGAFGGLGPIIAGAFTVGAVIAFAKTVGDAMGTAVQAASDLQETTGKFNVVFAGVTGEAQRMADEIASGYAMSKNEAMGFMASMQDMLKPMGMNTAEAAKMSSEIVKLSADMGSFNNLPTSQVMDDIRSAMVGNYETVRKYGTMISAASVEQSILNKGLASTKEEITPLMKAQEVYTQILENNADAVGDMARTHDSYANMMKRYSADLEDLAANVGGAIVNSEAFNAVLLFGGQILSDVSAWVTANKDNMVTWVNSGIMYVVDGFRVMSGAVGVAATVLTGLRGAGQVMAGTLLVLGGNALKVGSAFVKGFGIAFAPVQLLAKGVDLVGGALAAMTGQQWTSAEAKIASLRSSISGMADSTDAAGDAMVEMGGSMQSSGVATIASMGSVARSFVDFDKRIVQVKESIIRKVAEQKKEVETQEELSRSVVTADGKLKQLDDTTKKHAGSAKAAADESKKWAGLLKDVSDVAEEATREIVSVSQAQDLYNSALKEFETQVKSGSYDKAKQAADALNEAKKQLNNTQSEWMKLVDDADKVLSEEKVATISVTEATRQLKEAKEKLSQARASETRDVKALASALEEEDSKQKQLDEATKAHEATLERWHTAISAIGDAYQTAFGKSLEGMAQLDAAVNAFASGNTLGGALNAASFIGQNVGGQLGKSLSSTASLALAGSAFGPVGAIAGGAIGLISSFFGGDDEAKAARDDSRHSVYDTMVSNAQSGGAYSLELLRAGGYTYDNVANYEVPYELAGKSAGKRLLEDRGEDGAADLADWLQIMDTLSATVSSLTKSEITNTLDSITAKYEYMIATSSDLALAEEARYREIQAYLTGVTVDSMTSAFDSAMGSASLQEGTEALRLNIENSLNSMMRQIVISSVLESQMASLLDPILDEVVSVVTGGGDLTASGTLDKLSQASVQAASAMVPIFQSLYSAFDTAALLQKEAATSTTTSSALLTDSAATTLSASSILNSSAESMASTSADLANAAAAQASATDSTVAELRGLRSDVAKLNGVITGILDVSGDNKITLKSIDNRLDRVTQGGTSIRTSSV